MSQRSVLRSVSLSLRGLLVLGLSACYGPDQNFPIGSILWVRSNPEWVERHSVSTRIPKRILVAVLDSGVDYNHPRLVHHLVPFETPYSSGRKYGIGFDLMGGNGDYFPHFSVLNSDDGKDISKDLGLRDHGTHVSGLVTLENEEIGLLPVRVLPMPFGDRPGADFLLEGDEGKMVFIRDFIPHLSKGIRLACQRGADILNMSLGINYSKLTESHYVTEVERLVEQSLVAVIQDHCQNALLVVAAGNDSQEIDEQKYSMPATLSERNILSVGALSSKTEIAFFSNQGRFVDVFMQGDQIKSSIPSNSDDLRRRFNELGKLSGTSMATPLTANVAARVLIEAPMLQPEEARALILNTADLRELSTQAQPDVTPHQPSKKRMGLVVNPPRALQAAKEIAAAANQSGNRQIRDALKKRYLVAPFEHGNSPF